MEDTLAKARAAIDEADREIARLFEKRMEAVKEIALFKRGRSLPVLDEKREAEVLEKNAALIRDPRVRAYYTRFLKAVLGCSRDYQSEIMRACAPVESPERKTLRVELGDDAYDIIFERGALQNAARLLRLDRKVLIVTDTGVPASYARALSAQCAEGHIFTVEAGEQSKSLSVFEALLRKMLDAGFTRGDCVAAVGGGVVGDLAGYAAASFMRGVDFYNIPTTVLSQVDSSVGGKTALDLGGVKNAVGAFYQPKRVLIDPALLGTLPRRQVANGLAEAVKMALTCDAGLFSVFENEDVLSAPEKVILPSVRIKKEIVERDEKESGLRRVLNFGHTLGHAVESAALLTGMYHGECVALGMIPMCDPGVRERLVAVLEKLGLPCALRFSESAALKALRHDKKAGAGGITAVRVRAPGQYCFTSMQPEEFLPLLQIINRE